MDANVDIDGGTAPALTTGTTATEVELGTGATTFAVLPSGQSLTGKVINFQLEGGGTQHYTISTIGTLVAGRKYTITLSLKLNVITTVTETVVDWVDGGDNRDATGNPLYI